MVRVNFSEVEEFQPLPDGKGYHFRITDVDVDQNKDTAKHPGNDFWKLTATVQKGEQEGKTHILNVMLPPYEPYMLVNILRATVGQHEWSEEDVKSGEIDIDLDDMLDLEFLGDVRPQKNNSDYKEVRRIRPLDDASTDGDDLP